MTISGLDAATLAVIGIVLLFVAYLRGYHDGAVSHGQPGNRRTSRPR